MPRRPPTPCNAPGCGRLTHSRFCDTHNSRTDDRATPTGRGYGWRWRLLAKRYRAAHPLCRQCEARGRLTVAELVDHIIPVHVAPERRLDESNLQSLCRSCHAQKTRDDLQRYGSGSARGGGGKKL